MKKLLVFLTILAVSFSLGNILAQENGLSQKVSELADKLAFAVEGYVVGVRGETVYVDLGQKAGIVEGIRFEVVRLDKEHPFKKGEKIIGYPETEVGEIEITKVRKGMSLAKITNKIMEIQEGDKVYQKMKKVTRVAITEFIYGEEFNDFTKNVEDIFYTNLIQRGMTVVEREKLEQLLEEQKISLTGMIDLATAARVGKMLGVEAVVVGTVADMGNSLDIRARLVDVEKGVAITAAQVGVVKNPTVIGLLGTGARRAVYDMARPTVIKEGKRTIGEVYLPKSFVTEDGNWIVTVESCQLLEGRRLRFNLLIKNLREEVSACYISRRYTYLLDNLTSKWGPQDISIGDSYRNYTEFIPHTPTRAYVTFPPLKEGVESVVLNLYFYHKYRGGAHLVGKWNIGPIKLR